MTRTRAKADDATNSLGKDAVDEEVDDTLDQIGFCRFLPARRLESPNGILIDLSLPQRLGCATWVMVSSC